MGVEQEERVRALFMAARELPSAERVAFLDGQSGGDAGVRAEVESLLECDAASNSLLDRSPVGGRGIDSWAAGLPASSVGSDGAGPGGLDVGGSIGPYRLQSVLGEGGFGVVYLAERREPFVQRVAVKVIKPGMDSRSVIGRFEQERQALAVMDHPNVSRVLDGGITGPEAGQRPYFVMEYVRGQPLTEYCDQHRLTVRQRLELFLPVCEAVQHAHMKGIIHRDIKPGNVLVEAIDERAIPKVIDFGIAKAIGKALTDKTIFTESGQLVGTPEYVSPEQATAGAMDVDTRTDVYSLGVMLYEVLVGELPFDSAELRSKGYVEIQRVIREVDPPRPSTRLSRMGLTGGAVALKRRTTPQGLARELKKELEWIPLKAVRKDRSERYASPADLARDIRAYLDGRALEAGPESAAYRVRKYVRRHRGPVAAGAVVALALVVGTVVSVGFALKEAAARARESEALAGERKQRELAERREQETGRVAAFQARMLGQVDVTRAGSGLMKDLRARLDAGMVKRGVSDAERAARLDSLRDILRDVNATDSAAALIDRTILKPAVETVGREFVDQPLVEAALRQTLGNLYRNLGLHGSARPLQERALEIRRRVLGNEHRNTLNSLSEMGTLLLSEGRAAEAEALHREALEAQRRVLGEDAPETIATAICLALALKAQGEYAEAEACLGDALERQRRVVGEASAETLGAIGNMGTLLQAQARPAEAEGYYREALEKCRRFLGEEDPGTMRALTNLAALLQSQGRLEEAAPYQRDAVDGMRRALGEDHPDTLLAVGNMGHLLNALGRDSEAEPYYREMLEKGRAVVGPDHPSLVVAMSNLGGLLHTQGKSAEAEPYSREALELSRRVLGEEHTDTLTALGNLAVVLQGLNKMEEAEAVHREALEKSRRILGDDHPQTIGSVNNVGFLLHEVGKLAEAEPYYREALEKFRTHLGADHPSTLTGLNNLGRLLRDQKKLEEAEPIWREALEKRRKVLGDDHPRTLLSMANLAGLFQDEGKLDEAGPLFLEVVERRGRMMGPEHADTLRAVDQLGALRRQQGRYADAEALLLPAAALAEAGPPALRSVQRRLTGNLAALYEAWDRAEPGKGYDSKAAEWKARAADPAK